MRSTPHSICAAYSKNRMPGRAWPFQVPPPPATLTGDMSHPNIGCSSQRPMALEHAAWSQPFSTQVPGISRLSRGSSRHAVTQSSFPSAWASVHATRPSRSSPKTYAGWSSALSSSPPRAMPCIASMKSGSGGFPEGGPGGGGGGERGCWFREGGGKGGGTGRRPGRTQHASSAVALATATSNPARHAQLASRERRGFGEGAGTVPRGEPRRGGGELPGRRE
mmetsp:Transcript_15649/g.46157  ORF Transcript_15649/g.46157 Transcript_15649/m.46157 type:complete len:222 (-) Transcript_15649:63-728(-)